MLRMLPMKPDAGRNKPARRAFPAMTKQKKTIDFTNTRGTSHE